MGSDESRTGRGRSGRDERVDFGVAEMYPDSPMISSGRRRFYLAFGMLLLVQALKLGSRWLVLDLGPRPAMWGQLILVVWLGYMLLDGHRWARGTLALFGIAAAFLGLGMFFPFATASPLSLQVVGIVNIVLSGIASGMFQFDSNIAAFATRRADRRV